MSAINAFLLKHNLRIAQEPVHLAGLLSRLGGAAGRPPRQLGNSAREKPLPHG